MRSVETVRMRGAPAPSIFLGASCLTLHLIINNRYGVFRDELYFIVCGQHPAIGYVDQPPLVPWIAGASHAVFGVWLLPLRLAPALCMSATVMLATEFARCARYSQSTKAKSKGVGKLWPKMARRAARLAGQPVQG